MSEYKELDEDMKKLEELKTVMLENGWTEVTESDRDNDKQSESDIAVDDCNTSEDDKANELQECKDDEPVKETFEESLRFLDEMTGMDEIKEKFLRLGRYVKWKENLEGQGIDTSEYPVPNLTFMFLGDPGTGKTTVAYHMGRILHSLGLLSSSKVMEFRREDLIGENYGSEELKTKDALKRSLGSVFFLDESYECFRNATDERDPGFHVLETMMAQFGKPGRCIVMAGYRKEMLDIFKVNPGFKSRIPDDNIIEFASPSIDSLMNIFLSYVKRMDMTVTREARRLLRHSLLEKLSQKDTRFGNARYIRQLTETTVINHANRIMKTGNFCDSPRITKADVSLSLEMRIKEIPAHSRIGFV